MSIYDILGKLLQVADVIEIPVMLIITAFILYNLLRGVNR